MPVFDVCRKKLLMNIFKLDFSASKYCSIFMFNTVLDLKQSKCIPYTSWISV